MPTDLTKGFTGRFPSAEAGNTRISDGSKPAVRRLLAARRAALAPQEAREKSKAAQERLLGDPRWRAARSVALYAAVRDEIGTRRLADEALRTGKTLLLPRVTAVSGIRKLEFAPCTGPGDLVPGVFGIPEPDVRRCPVWEATPDLLVLPAVGLDRQGVRLGYGGGYYDRYLSRPERRTCPRIGLAFGVQIVENLPCDPWDIRVDALLDEEALTWL